MDDAAKDTIELLLEAVDTDTVFDLVGNAAKVTEESTLLDCSSS